MANLKQRLHRKNSSGSYDVIYLETLASLVKMDDGTTLTSKISSMDTAINGKAASGHTHSAATASAAGFMTGDMVTKLNGIAAGANKYTHPSAKQCNYAYTHPSTKQCNYSVDTSGFATASHSHSTDNITSGVLSVDRGGTGCGSLDELKNLIQTWAPKTYNGTTYTQRVQVYKSFRTQSQNHNWAKISWLDLRNTIFNGSNVVAVSGEGGSAYNLSNLSPVYYVPSYDAYIVGASYESGAIFVGYGLSGDNQSNVPSTLIFYLL